MEKERWQSVREQIAEIPLEEIIERTLEKVPERAGMVNDPSDQRFLCPFHEDHSGRHFGLYRNRKGVQMWHCFVCDELGDCYAFVEKALHVDFKTAMLSIAAEFGIISAEEFEEETNSKLSFRPSGRTKRIVHASNTAELRSVDEISTVYSLLQELSPLSEDDRAYLNGRGITDHEIRLYGYFTMPQEDILPRLVKELSGKGLQEGDLIGVPGFYREVSGGRLRMAAAEGIAIPIIDEERRIRAIQVRLRGRVAKGARYKFFSSRFTEKERCRDQFEKGCGPESTVGIAYPYELDNLNSMLCITEGMFKAEKFAQRFRAIGLTVQGVTNTKGVVPMLSRLKERFSWQTNPVIILAFDMDMWENRQVFKAAKKLVRSVEEEGWTVMAAQWDPQFKGLDDVIIANPGRKCVRLVPFEKLEDEIRRVGVQK